MIKSGTPTFVQGFLFGCFLAFCQIIFAILIILATVSLSNNGYLTLIVVGIMLIITTCMAFTFVGKKASERTGTVVIGRNVATWTGFWSSASYLVGIFALLVWQVDIIRITSQQMIDSVGLNFHYTNLIIILILLYMCLPIALLTTLVGFALGSIGGRLWQKSVLTAN